MKPYQTYHPEEDTFVANWTCPPALASGRTYSDMLGYEPVTDISPKPTQEILGTQVGGSHYTDCAIQPIEYIWANHLGFSEGNVIKYITRWRSKGGIKDLEKAKHHIALLIEHAQNTGVKGLAEC